MIYFTCFVDTLIGATNNCTVSTGPHNVNMDLSQPSLMDMTPSLDGKLVLLIASYMEVSMDAMYDNAVLLLVFISEGKNDPHPRYVGGKGH